MKVVKFDRTMIFRVSCGRDTSCPTLKGECRLRVFKKRVLRNILGPKREELTGDKGRWVGGVCGRRCIQSFYGGNTRDTTWRTLAQIRGEC